VTIGMRHLHVATTITGGTGPPILQLA